VAFCHIPFNASFFFNIILLLYYRLIFSILRQYAVSRHSRATLGNELLRTVHELTFGYELHFAHELPSALCNSIHEAKPQFMAQANL
jgi:hypothetical protein